jgi:hypothetical protein
VSKTSNQSRAPISAAFVEAMRQEFGEEEVKVMWVREGDISLGEKTDEVWADVF